MSSSREVRTLPTEKVRVDGESKSFLAVRHLSKHFGALRAVEDVSFEVYPGQIFSIIGPNGAGKTTLFSVITGVYRATAGQVVFCGQDIVGLQDYRISRLGIARTFQKIRLFRQISVLDNVLVGMYCRTKSGVGDAFLRTPRLKREEETGRQRALELLRFVGIYEYQEYFAGHLSYGDQRRLEIARALATEPKVLLLDEPTAGMNPVEKEEMMSLIRTIRDDGITVLIVEHDMKVIMGMSDWVVVINHGEKIAEGTPKEVQQNQDVIEAYLGEEFQDEPIAS